MVRSHISGLSSRKHQLEKKCPSTKRKYVYSFNFDKLRHMVWTKPKIGQFEELEQKLLKKILNTTCTAQAEALYLEHKY